MTLADDRLSPVLVFLAGMAGQRPDLDAGMMLVRSFPESRSCVSERHRHRGVERPKPKPTDILLKIKAIALNRADLGSARATPATALRPASRSAANSPAR